VAADLQDEAMSHSIPVIRDVDVLVVGAGVGAVTSALSSRLENRSVALAGDQPYFGDDLAGRLNLWADRIDRRDPILQRAFSSSGSAGAPARPVVLKSVLEEALIEAGVYFLFMVRPVAVLRDREGMIGGVVFAARTALFAITCRTVIDATTQGLVGLLAGVPLQSAEAATRHLSWTVIGKEAPAAWPGTVEKLSSVHTLEAKDGKKQELHAFQLGLVLGSDAGLPASSGHQLRSHLVEDVISFAAEHPVDPIRRTWVGGRGYEAEPGLFLLGRVLPQLSEREFLDPGHLAVLGREVGALASKTADRKFSQPLTAHTHGETACEARFGSAFLRGEVGRLELTALRFPSLGAYEVVVAGGGTGGAPAGIAAAREGARTLVIESQHGLGGVGTVGMICSYWFGNKVGFTAELNNLLGTHDSLSSAKKGNMWNPVAKSGLYHRLLQQAGGTAWLNSQIFGVRKEGHRVVGVLVSTPFGCGWVDAGCVVDATGNADVAAAAGAPCRLIDERHVAVQGTGISPLAHPGILHQNSDHTFIEENDPEGLTLARVHARRKYPDQFDTSSLVDSRERRQILGDLEVSPLDLLAGRTFPDTVFTARSNFDTHGFIIHPVFMISPPQHQPFEAHVPFRCMLPRGIERVLVTGLGMSAHRDALPVVRMQADVQNQGYVAGLAAVEAIRRGCDLRELDIRALQGRLVERGILAADVPEHRDSFPLDSSRVLAATENPMEVQNVAILLAHPGESRAALLGILRGAGEESLKEQAALILGFQGSSEAVLYLAEWLEKHEWDEGWNYRGMGQFGPSMSRMDAVLTALVRCGNRSVVPIVAARIRQLGSGAEFSHCRAVALLAPILDDPVLADALLGLLKKPGMQGHYQRDAREALARLDNSSIETESRNLALRELYLARGLFLCGDPEGLASGILREYARDIRGHFALHARSVLERGRAALDRNQMA
jgi:hypothetical protein